VSIKAQRAVRFFFKKCSTGTLNLMPKKRTAQPLSPNLLDYPSSMSAYERESQVAEAILAVKKQKRDGRMHPKKAAVGKRQLAKLGERLMP
jgi:hypothetical protein